MNAASYRIHIFVLKDYVGVEDEFLCLLSNKNSSDSKNKSVVYGLLIIAVLLCLFEVLVLPPSHVLNQPNKPDIKPYSVSDNGGIMFVSSPTNKAGGSSGTTSDSTIDKCKDWHV